jgi:hypothetical protein
MKKQIIPITFLFAAILMFSSFNRANAQTNIIGKPKPIPIQYTLQVAEKDFPNQMNWAEAKKACEALGEGWRLPSKDELNSMYINRNEIGGFTTVAYWSSTEAIPAIRVAWMQYFSYGSRLTDDKTNKCYVRAVRNAL